MDKVPMTRAVTALEEELKHRQQVERPRIIRRSPKRARTAISLKTPSTTPRRSRSPSMRAAIAELEDKISPRRGHRRLETLGRDHQVRRDREARSTRTPRRRRPTRSSASNEADVKLGKVSITSPIARALIGKKTGDSVEVNTPGGGKSYEIVAVAFV